MAVGLTDRLIRLTTAVAVATVAAVAAVISYRYAYELVSTHGEIGMTARLVAFNVDGLILAASMLILDANQRSRLVPPLACWCLGAGILATIGANLAHGLCHGPVGALVSAWPALAMAGSFELLMTLIRSGSQTSTMSIPSVNGHRAAPSVDGGAPLAPPRRQVSSGRYSRGTHGRSEFTRAQGVPHDGNLTPASRTPCAEGRQFRALTPVGLTVTSRRRAVAGTALGQQPAGVSQAQGGVASPAAA